MSDTPTAPTTLDTLWTHGEEEVRTYRPVPPWIDQEILAREVAGIIHGGCESGAYMPAREAWTARITMGRYGDQVMSYIAEAATRPAAVADEALELGASAWSDLSVAVLSRAVELWAASIADQLAQALTIARPVGWYVLRAETDGYWVAIRLDNGGRVVDAVTELAARRLVAIGEVTAPHAWVAPCVDSGGADVGNTTAAAVVAAYAMYCGVPIDPGTVTVRQIG